MAVMVDEKDRLKGDKKIPLGEFVKRVAGYLKPEIGRFILAGILILINVGLDVVLPLITAAVTDNLSSDTPVLSYVILMAVV